MKSVIEKVKKLLALSQSPEPNEAALAMQRARCLMDKHGITASDLEVADIGERKGEAGKYKTPPDYITNLAETCADLFECGVFYNTKSWRKYNGYRSRNEYRTCPVFIGPEPNNEICAYTYDVLVLQLIRARKNYQGYEWQPHLVAQERNSYALGWVEAVRSKVADMVPPKPAPTIPDETGLISLTAVEAYIKAKVDNHFSARTGEKFQDALLSGYADGQAVDIRKGMGTTAGLSLSEGAS